MMAQGFGPAFRTAFCSPVQLLQAQGPQGGIGVGATHVTDAPYALCWLVGRSLGPGEVTDDRHTPI